MRIHVVILAFHHGLSKHRLLGDGEELFTFTIFLGTCNVYKEQSLDKLKYSDCFVFFR